MYGLTKFPNIGWAGAYVGSGVVDEPTEKEKENSYSHLNHAKITYVW